MAALITINAALFTYMFSSFYIKNYKKEKLQCEQQQQLAKATAKNNKNALKKD